MEHRIIRTEEYTPLAILFDENGLHADPEEGRDDDSIAIWRCEELIDADGNPAAEGEGKLIAAAELIHRAGVYVLQHIAVADEYKGQGFGAELLSVVEDDVKRRFDEDAENGADGQSEIWLCAKVPGFYKKYDWQYVDRCDAPNFTSCFECEDFGTICKPEVMKKILK